MSEGFELGPFHVPQQSRRDKLRSLEGSCSGLHPLYDPMLTCAAGDAILHPPLASLPPPVKQESFNLMGFAPTAERSELPHFSLSSSTSSPSHHHLVDLPPSLPVNPNTTYICPPQESHNFRNFEQPLLDNNRLLYKPPAPPSFHIPQNSGMMTQGLSLSLSPQTFNRETSVLPDKGMDSYIVIGGDMSRSIGPLGPFTGYAEVLKGSRFLKPAQQLLEEFCDVGQRAYMEGVSAADVEMDRLLDNTVITDDPSGIGSSGDHEEHHRRKTRLVSMLNEVCRGYKYYYQQMQAVVASFESVHGLSKAAPFTPLALKTLSRHFRNLKNAIATQLRSSCKARVEDSSSKDDEPQFRIAEQNLEHQRVAHASSVYEQPHVWRPQRGLPERAVAVLRAWLFEHFLHPYPTDSDKHMLAKQTGLSRNQVSNWFINARVRLWKPMVEEIHSLEMRQTQKAPECSRDQELNKQANTSIMQVLPSHELFQGNTGQNDRQSCAENQHGTELSGLSSNGAQQINFSYDGITTQRNSAVDVGVGHQMGGGNAGVSLTLGLHQSNGACLPESYPLSVAHFGIGGLGASNTSYAGFGGFSGQIRHFDGQLLHDFVG